jgi:hypothetical protein
LVPLGRHSFLDAPYVFDAADRLYQGNALIPMVSNVWLLAALVTMIGLAYVTVPMHSAPRTCLLRSTSPLTSLFAQRTQNGLLGHGRQREHHLAPR